MAGRGHARNTKKRRARPEGPVLPAEVEKERRRIFEYLIDELDIQLQSAGNFKEAAAIGKSLESFSPSVDKSDRSAGPSMRDSFLATLLDDQEGDPA